MKTRPTTRPAAGPLAKESTLSTLPDFLRAFEENTGWPLRFVPGDPVPSDPEVVWASRIGTPTQGVGELRMSLGGMSPLVGHRSDLEDAAALANAYATLLCELLHTRDSLRKSATRTGPTAQPARTSSPAEFGPPPALEPIDELLATAVTKLGAHAGLLYVLNDATTHLKLRARYNVGAEYPTLPARPLATANADLEAMSGYAVVIEAPHERGEWILPAPCQAAVCLPVADESQVLGTLWVLANTPRTFSDQALQQAEIVACQLARELCAHHAPAAAPPQLEPSLAF